MNCIQVYSNIEGLEVEKKKFQTHFKCEYVEYCNNNHKMLYAYKSEFLSQKPVSYTMIPCVAETQTNVWCKVAGCCCIYDIAKKKYIHSYIYIWREKDVK